MKPTDKFKKEIFRTETTHKTMADFPSPRTDLACETRPSPFPTLPGIQSEEYTEYGTNVSAINILDEQAAQQVGKPCGQYVTLSREKLWQLSGKEYRHFHRILARQIRKMAISMCGRDIDGNFGVLTVGLGNREITADAIGPQTVAKLSVTRHLRARTPALFAAIGRCNLSALAPGVLGQTGIETVELIRGAVANAHPDLVIAVDALVARSCKRLASTIQLSNRGIDPGSGIGNHRQSICSASIGAPVLALGVPTVVDSSTLVYDALAQAGIQEIGDELRTVLENRRGFFVSPKESDVITTNLSTLLADAIETAFTIEA